MVNLCERIDSKTAKMYLSQQRQSMAEHRYQLDREAVAKQLSQKHERMAERKSKLDEETVAEQLSLQHERMQERRSILVNRNSWQSESVKDLELRKVENKLSLKLSIEREGTHVSTYSSYEKI